MKSRVWSLPIIRWHRWLWQMIGSVRLPCSYSIVIIALCQCQRYLRCKFFKVKAVSATSGSSGPRWPMGLTSSTGIRFLSVFHSNHVPKTHRFAVLHGTDGSLDALACTPSQAGTNNSSVSLSSLWRGQPCGWSCIFCLLALGLALRN